MLFADMTAPEIGGLDRAGTLVVAPIAACEQHAAHLPVFTDSILAGAVAAGLERALRDQVLLLPVLWLGASEHHRPFGGTLTATLRTYETLLVELIAPLLEDGFQRVLLLNGHGGNIDPLRTALRRLDAAYPGRVLTGAAYWQLATPELAALCDGPLREVGHACEIETSMMLHLRPDLVRPDLATDDGNDRHGLPDGLTWARDFSRRTAGGAIGYPRLATAQKGQRMLAAVVERVTHAARAVLDLPAG
jgi:creatinine amidohydrolase